MTAPAVRIRLLGSFEIRLGDAPAPALDSARAESLLAYLVIHRDAPQPRQRLAFLLWPDSDEAQARTNLRHVLHNVRRALPDLERFIEVTPRTLRWRPDAPLQLDVAELEHALAEAETDKDVNALRRAVDAYAGDLLEGSYDEWVLEERDRLREAHLHTLERLVALLDERGDIVDATRYAERLLRADPLREATYQRLMRLHAARGDRARALRIYHECTGVLERELGVEPGAATQDLYEALLPARVEAAAPAATRAASLVGRAGEWARLTELWRAAAAGHAQLVLICGEPGVGKTRLAEELRSWCAHRGAATALARSYASEGALAYGPIVEWLRSPPIAALLPRLDAAHRAELARLLPELHRQRQSRQLPGGGQRQRLYEALAHALLRPAEPLLLIADDMQWADEDTLRFLHYLIRRAPEARVLVLATARREDIGEPHRLNDLVRGLRALDRVVEIELDRLSHQETTVLADALTGRALDEHEADRLFSETEGNPLFVVEAVRAHRMSPRIQAILESRIAQLSERARELAGVAATIGREFGWDLLVAASEVEQRDVVRALDELWRRRIIREQGADAYDFSHDKLREAAYSRLSPAARRHHHLRVARALERAPVAAIGAQVAAHFDRAGAAREAVRWYERAAADAQRVYASEEAVRQLDRGLELLRALPAGEERDREELALLTALLAPLAVVEGAASRRVTEIQRRALALARVPPAPLLRSVALTSLTRGRFDEATRAGRELSARGGRDGDRVLVVEGHYVLGICAFWRGELAAAREHFEAAVELARPEQRAVHLVHYGLDPKVVCLSRLANTLWLLGEPEAARRARDGALVLADELGHPATTGTALVFAAWLAVDLGDDDGVRQHTAALAAMGPDHETKAPAVAAEALGGYVDVLDGRAERGFARLRAVLAETRQAAYAPGQHASIVRLLLAACEAAGDADAGLQAADQALALGSPARVWETEVRRLRAQFLAAVGGPRAEIDDELRRALAVATEQGALALVQRVQGTLAERARRHRAAT